MSKKPDELDNYLKRKYPNNYITGDDRCSLLVWGSPTKDGIIPKLCTLTIGVDYESHYATRDVIIDSVNTLWRDPTSPIRRLYNYGKLIAQYSNIEFGIICFPTRDNASKDNETISFLTVFSSDAMLLNKSVVMNGRELRQKLISTLDLTTTQTGTSKDKNKSTADFFHDWSRDNMPSSITKFDIDGILVNFNGNVEKILIEIKRSNIPPIPEWKPYLEDMPDFILLFRLSSATGSEMWIMHHNGLGKCTDDTVVSLFVVEGVSEGELSYSKEYREIKLGGPGQTVESIIRSSLHI